ncbi:Sapep family Mn(2+)-dependent dipeptidase [Clostridium sp. AM58-1XD]|uniref:Sapep family Mn(2+)-dependent dipeptidase n=1 Tax=Clostridium sp. AM58-1XD TaxID=2292307 RepID=UPI000E4AA8D2|nr:Sapep family Mn(2+)-dependent dipeptidase [Clostridium sp. AM58-1XD]RGY97292.1 M20/M25/M40 family metallo-hydrolase [Clostridium sp. AM58-1XD]
MDYRKEIEAYMEEHKQEMIDDICELCRINSEKQPYKEGMPYGEGINTALAAALSMAEKYGFSINNYDAYVGTADLNDGEKCLDILAHLDVVPAGEGWKVTEPFEPVVKDGKLYGRGTADDKGPAVAALYAMRAVKELGIPVTKNVRLLLGTDEECGSSDIPHYYAVEEEAPMTFSPDAAFPVVNTEKGALKGHFTAEWEKVETLPRLCSVHAGLKVNVLPGKAEAVIQGLEREVLEQAAETTEKKTGVTFEMDYWDHTDAENDTFIKVTAIGKGGHAAEPEEANNALTGLIAFINILPLCETGATKALKALEELIPHGDIYGEHLGVAMEDELSGKLTLVFSMLEVTETGLDGWFDSRCPVCATDENVRQTAKKNMEAKGIHFLTESMRPPHHVDGNSQFIKTLLAAYEEYTGRKGECQSMGGGTYVHNLKNGVAFGASMPETDNRMHGADEFAIVDELVTSAKIFAQVIAELCR